MKREKTSSLECREGEKTTGERKTSRQIEDDDPPKKGRTSGALFCDVASRARRSVERRWCVVGHDDVGAYFKSGFWIRGIFFTIQLWVVPQHERKRKETSRCVSATLCSSPFPSFSDIQKNTKEHINGIIKLEWSECSHRRRRRNRTRPRRRSCSLRSLLFFES